MSNPIVNFALRGFQVLFSAVVLGLSVGLATGHKWGSAPAVFGYGGFVGAISLIGAFVGIASNWVELLQGVIGAGIDGIVLLANIAGGIIFAYKMRGVNCAVKDDDFVGALKLIGNSLVNGGCIGKGDGRRCYYIDEDPSESTIRSRCRQNQADSAFMFLTSVILIAAITMALLRKR